MFIEKLIVTSETNSTKFALELGGTLSGEHGIGLLKKAFLEEALGEVSVDVQRRSRTRWTRRDTESGEGFVEGDFERGNY